MTQTIKSMSRTTRSRAVTDSLTRTQAQRLEHLFENAPSIKNTHWDPNRNDADVINGQSLLNIRSMHSHKQRYRKISSVDDRIVINICGDRYETHRTTLELYPDTLLGNPKRRKHYYDSVRREYFFDRHRACFQAILYYYQSHGRLRRPDYVPLDIFLEEVTFFQLGQEALSQIRKDENIKEVKKVPLPKNRIRRYIWTIMEYPDFSLFAKIVNIISLIMILISIVVLAIESLPQYVELDDIGCQVINKTVTTTFSTINSTDQTTVNDNYTCHSYFSSFFFIIQIICVGYFTIEFILRILTTPSLCDFLKSLMNWIDFLAVVPFYITLIIRLSGKQDHINANAYIVLRLLRILRLARVLKICRIFKTVKSLRVLATTVRQSLLDFIIMIIILTLLGFLFGAAAYYAENDANNLAYDSILEGTYWGIITITSVGYGDITPITPIGRVITCLCALSGAATIGMLVSVLVDRYQRVYARKLFINDDEIHFYDDSDGENNDSESKVEHSSKKSQINSKIEDPDAHAKDNAINQADNSIEVSQTPDSIREIKQNSSESNTNRIHFIIGYVDNESQETSQTLVEKISSIVADKQSTGDNISLNIISNGNSKITSPYDVRFQLESDNDNDDDEDLTEIHPSNKSRGSVLKTFQHSVSQNDEIYV